MPSFAHISNEFVSVLKGLRKASLRVPHFTLGDVCHNFLQMKLVKLQAHSNLITIEGEQETMRKFCLCLFKSCLALFLCDCFWQCLYTEFCFMLFIPVRKGLCYCQQY